MSAFASGDGGGADQKSIITLYVISHGKDIPEAPFSDPSVRILSQAGKFGCLGFFNYIEPTKVKAWITSLKEKNSQISTYSILEKINILFEIASDINMGIFNPEKYITEEDKNEIGLGNKTVKYRQSKHTKKTIDANEDWQIYTPIMDHLYDFTDKKIGKQGIFIVDIKNKPESFTYDIDDDLSIKEIHLKEAFKEMPILEFFLRHLVLEDHDHPGQIIDELNKL
jgi:hypothetical protein